MKWEWRSGEVGGEDAGGHDGVGGLGVVHPIPTNISGALGAKLVWVLGFAWEKRKLEACSKLI